MKTTSATKSLEPNPTNPANPTCKDLLNDLFIKIKNLETKLENLETIVEKTSDELAVSKQVNNVLNNEVERLREQIDDHEQYSRRNCLVITGLLPNKNESVYGLQNKIKNLVCNHMTSDDALVHPSKFDYEFDKCHRLGSTKD